KLQASPTLPFLTKNTTASSATSSVTTTTTATTTPSTTPTPPPTTPLIFIYHPPPPTSIRQIRPKSDQMKCAQSSPQTDNETSGKSILWVLTKLRP
ncbi:unnamed protein product, partial [Hymenolepis diminuta]